MVHDLYNLCAIVGALVIVGCISAFTFTVWAVRYQKHHSSK